MRNRLVGGAISVGAIVLAIGGAVLLHDSADKVEAAAGLPAIPVRVASAAIRPMADIHTDVATLKATREVQVSPPAAGFVTAIHAADGADLTKGATILTLGSTVQQADLANAKARLDLAVKALKRDQELAARGVATRIKLETGEAEIVAARAQVTRAESVVAERQLRAPFAGEIGKIGVSVGAYVTPGQVIAILRDDSQLYVDIDVPVTLLNKVRVGSRFTLVSEQPGVGVREGTISFIAPGVDPLTRSLALRGELVNPDHDLRPGMFVRVDLHLNERPGAIAVPEAALNYSLAGQSVFRVRGGKAEQVPVAIGAQVGEFVEITSGLVAGDVVVTDGRNRLRHGDPVAMAQPEG